MPAVGQATLCSDLRPYFRLGLLSMVDVWWMMDRSSDEARKWFRRCAWRDYAYWQLGFQLERVNQVYFSNDTDELWLFAGVGGEASMSVEDLDVLFFCC